MPRARSSSSRSVLVPVSASTSAVLPWSMWPAVPSVSAISPRAAPARPRRRRARGSTSSSRERARVEQQPPLDHAPDDRRRALAQRRLQLAARVGQGAGRALQAERGQGAAADAGLRLDDLAAERLRQPLGARAHGVERLVRHPQHGQRGSAPARGRGAGAASPPAPRARAGRCAAPGPAGGGGSARPPPRAPTMSPACGPPSSLSPLKQASVAPAAIDPRASGSPASTGSPTSTPEPRSSTTGTPCARPMATSALQRDVLGEADDAVVGRVGAQDQRGLGADRALVVGRRGCGWWRRPRPGARPSRRGSPGCGSRRRSRRAGRARRRPRAPPRTRPARAPARRRCCSRRARPRRRSAPRSSGSTWLWRLPRPPVRRSSSRFA